jgi:hypothetical protein
VTIDVECSYAGCPLSGVCWVFLMSTVTFIDVRMNAVMLSVVYIECHVFYVMLNVVMLAMYAYLSLILAKYR